MTLMWMEPPPCIARGTPGAHSTSSTPIEGEGAEMKEPQLPPLVTPLLREFSDPPDPLQVQHVSHTFVQFTPILLFSAVRN